MDSNATVTPPAQPPNKAILSKGRKARKLEGPKYWKGMSAFWIGISIAVGGGLIAMTVPGNFGNFAKICCMVGLAIFVYGLIVESTVLVYRLIKER